MPAVPAPPPGPPRLSPAARRLVAGVTISSFGTGLTLPFTFILLSEVRGLSLPTTGLLLALPGVVGLVAVPVSGVLADRFGPAVVLRLCLLLQAVGNGLLGLATTPARAAVALTLVGAGLGPSFPAGSALLSGLAGSGAGQARAFGLQFTLLNAGIGVGGLVSAAVIDVDRASTFVVLYAVSAVSAVAYAALVPAAAPRAEVPAGEVEVAPSYREVLGDPVFRRVWLLSLLLALTGYAALDGGLAAYARVVGEVPPSSLGLVFAVNTVVIVAGQLGVLRVIGHWRRTRALGVAAAVWAVSWSVLLLLPVVHGRASVVLVLVFGGMFGAGEIFLAPALQPLVNALATDRLRGRYNALSQSSFSIAFVVSPAIAAGLVAGGLGLVWVGLLVAGSVSVVVVVLRLRPRLSDLQDGIAHVPPVPGLRPAAGPVAGPAGA